MAEKQDVIEQNLQWAIRQLRKAVRNREFSKILISIQGGVITRLTEEKSHKPDDIKD